MFLNRLTIEEKKAFLKLAHHIARSDQHFCEKEQNVINKYCMEMQMDDIDYDETEFDLSNVLELFEKSEHKKIALLEIMALVYADGEQNEAEQHIINTMVKEFKLNPNLAVVYETWSKSILALFIQGEALVHL